MDRNGRPAHGGAMRSEGDYGDFSKKIMNYIKFRLVTMKKYPNIIESFALFGTLLFFSFFFFFWVVVVVVLEGHVLS